MSFYYNNQKMIHAAVNTDPLNLNMITEHKESVGFYIIKTLLLQYVVCDSIMD